MSGRDGRVHVVVPTSTCLSLEEADALGVTLVPLHVTIDGRDRRDVVDVSPAELYRLLRARVVPTTSAPTLGDYLTAFATAGGPVLCLSVGGRISAMDTAARLAAEAREEGPVEIVETETAAGGMRLVAVAAARLAAEGLGLDEVARRVREISARVEMVGMLETVEFLARSGRVPDIAHWGSSVLRVRPVVRFQAGRGSLVTLVRSPMRGVEEIRKVVREAGRRQGAGPCGEGLVCAVFHGDAPEPARELHDRVREDWPEAELSVSEMTAAMATHVGPGLVGEALYVRPDAAGAG
jgi:DegV family protein with EDD domain